MIENHGYSRTRPYRAGKSTFLKEYPCVWQDSTYLPEIKEMKNELKETLSLLDSLYTIHHNNALNYSYQSICQHRFNGFEKQAQKSKEEALFHDGQAKGLQTGIVQIQNLLNYIVENDPVNQKTN